MIKLPVISRLLNNLESYITDLRTATDITHEKYTRDIRLQRFVERTLQISIECCFDIVHHIIAENGFREPVLFDTLSPNCELKFLHSNITDDIKGGKLSR